MARFGLLLGASFVLLAGFTVVQTARHDSTETPVAAAPRVLVPEGAAERFAGALRIRTISSEDPAAFDAKPFRALHAYLKAAFPLVHAQLRRETVGAHSLLYTWQGSNPSLAAILLAGHIDVVPVDSATGAGWHEDPFGGRIIDGLIWGRGAIDNKSAVVGTLEAVEMLLHEGFRPARTVYLAFGHDEEVGGAQGAREIAALLNIRGVELEMVLDEGGVIGDGMLSGLSEPVALVGIAEKGFVTVELSTRAGGGHSSLPPRQSAVGILSAAVAKLEDTQMPARLEGATRQLFDRIGPRVSVSPACTLRQPVADEPARAEPSRKEPHYERHGPNDHRADDLPGWDKRQRASQLRAGRHQFPDPAGRHGGWRPATREPCHRRQPHRGEDGWTLLDGTVHRVPH
jgi:carboxypeptidase PM20D1